VQRASSSEKIVFSSKPEVSQERIPNLESVEYIIPLILIGFTILQWHDNVQNCIKRSFVVHSADPALKYDVSMSNVT
jgi:hypothetical protein